MTKIKICGITNRNDARAATNLEVDALGFVFYPPSPRAVTPDKAKRIRQEIPPFTLCVGVFVNETKEAVLNVAKTCRLDALQFHGNESPEYCAFFSDYKIIKAFSLKNQADLDSIPRYQTQAFLIDAYDPKQHGGTGKKADWELARAAKGFGPVILAGGLDKTNVCEAIREVKPYAVDVCSGVELSPGIKDPVKLRNFVEMVRKEK